MRYILLLIVLVLLVGCTCVENDTACCKGGDCVNVAIDCIENHTGVFKGCNDECMPVWDCEPIDFNNAEN